MCPSIHEAPEGRQRRDRREHVGYQGLEDEEALEVRRKVTAPRYAELDPLEEHTTLCILYHHFKP